MGNFTSDSRVAARAKLSRAFPSRMGFWRENGASPEMYFISKNEGGEPARGGGAAAAAVVGAARTAGVWIGLEYY